MAILLVCEVLVVAATHTGWVYACVANVVIQSVTRVTTVVVYTLVADQRILRKPMADAFQVYIFNVIFMVRMVVITVVVITTHQAHNVVMLFSCVPIYVTNR